MFCIKSDVITLGSIEMYGLVTVWMSMDDGPYLSCPESRSDPVGGSEPVSGTRDHILGLFT